MTPYEARVAGDRSVATSCEPVPGGVRLRTPELPASRDYNGVLLAPGAPLDVDDDVRRVNAFDFTGPVPDGWTALEMLVMAFDDAPPAMPDGVAVVEIAVLREARAEVWRSYGLEAGDVEQMLHMQALEAAAGTLLAHVRDGSAIAWAQVVGGYIDDVFVAEAERGRGLGRLLTVAAMASGGRFLFVEPDNESAMRLYRGLGFVQAATLTQLTRG